LYHSTLGLRVIKKKKKKIRKTAGGGTTRVENTQGTPTQSHISPSILVKEGKGAEVFPS